MSSNIIYFSRFLNSLISHGGDKRTAQICEILNHFDYDFVSMCNPPFTIPKKLSDLLHNPRGYFQAKRSQRYKHKITNSKYIMWNERFRDCLLNMHLLAQLFVDCLDSKPDLICIDDPVFLAPVVHHAKSKGIPLVAFCHNVETLSREQVEFSSQREIFTYELELMAMCDLLITISTEETWLLKNFGMDPIYLPYFPLKSTADRMKEVRKRRLLSVKSGFLLLGTVYNLPTLDGMNRVIAAITDGSILLNERLYVAGYGTGQLLSQLDNPCIELRGDVTDAELDELMINTKGCIVYQETGSGALTKVPELLAAGVPVIINSHAARSHHNLPGIFEFGTFEQLGDQMEAAAISDHFPLVLSPPSTSFIQKRIAELLR